MNSDPCDSPGLSRVVEVTAPSRLHFGLISFGDESALQFGGAGVMLRQPALRLKISAGARLESHGPLASRAVEFARSWATFHAVDEEPKCHIEICAAPPQHVGLGVGTQLGLSVAAGLNAFFDRPSPSAAELALSVGRGLRSAVGAYGFAQGGLIAERGKLSHQQIGELDCRLDLPGDWRFVLIRPEKMLGLSGVAERHAFSDLSAVPTEVSEKLRTELRERMFPAAAQGKLLEFSQSVHAYGLLAGSCFADIQGGPYNGARSARLVEVIRSLGVQGVGQSSWGPTIFAILENESEAQRLKTRLAEELPDEDYHFVISPPNNDGAQIEWTSR